jgi:putative ATP-binding cassette transporter
LGQAPAGFMFYAAAASAGLGTGAVYLLGRKLPWLNYKQQKLEADFRTNMVRVREHAESIALNNSEKVEKEILDKSFDPVITNSRDLLNTRKKLLVASSIYANYSFPIPYVIAAPGFWVGAATYGTLMQANYAFGQIQGCFSWFMDNFQALASLKATVDRLDEFNTEIDRSNADFARKNDPARSADETVKVKHRPAGNPAPRV